jgi:hypothetical protein
MKGYKEPGFQDRAATSARAKSNALKKLKDAPKPDEAELAARIARQQERDAKAAAKRAEKQQARLLEQERLAEAKREREKPAVPALSEAEAKAARDARYAARKMRKR